MFVLREDRMIIIRGSLLVKILIMLLQNIPGHDNMKNELLSMFREDRMPHAMMWLGPSGNGALALAIAWAQFLQCEDQQEDQACGKCSSCRKASKLQHPDIHLVYPVPRIGKANTSGAYGQQWREAFLENPFLELNDWLRLLDAENKQANISKAECMDIIHQLGLKAFESPYKMMIIWLPEYLGKEGNRLLKIIEEPPENTHFILVAEDEEQILNTIRSRCQILRMGGIKDEEIVSYLSGQQGLDREKAVEIAYLAGGNMNTAIRIASDQADDNANLFLEWMRLCYVGNGVELIDWVERFSRLGRENQKHFMQFALHFLRELFASKRPGKDKVRLRKREAASAIKLAGMLDLDQIERAHGLFNEIFTGLERNAHVKILLLDASIRMHRIFKKVPERALVI